ncbi:MAG: hypothetical protein WBZ00_11805, partial [Solirubrobacterales bacterium]
SGVSVRPLMNRGWYSWRVGHYCFAWKAAPLDTERVTRMADAEAVMSALDEWVGARVSVRIATGEPEELLAVLSGRLGRRSDEKAPARFWPLDESDPPMVERPGIYLHPETFDGARLHTGGFVIEFRHLSVTTNVRKLSPTAGLSE